MEAYLDNAATTSVFPEVRDIMNTLMEEDFGNPSSKHTKGMIAEKYINDARDIICSQLKCDAREIVFTSGGTESNNMALIGAATANMRAGKHIITTRIEHPSVHEPLAYLEELGFEVTYLPVNEKGQLEVDVLLNAIREDTILISVMYVNNEVGSVLDVKALCDAAKKKNPSVLFHVDAIQGYGKYKIVPKKLGIDLMSVSGHKIHGPKGSGFIYIKNRTKIRPIIFGGGQQKGMRSGTENVPAIAGFGKASEIIYTAHSEKIERLYELKKYFIDNINKIEDVTVNAVDTEDIKASAPHIVSVSFGNIRSEVMLHALAEKGVFVSSGSACSSNHPELSGTLKAIGVKNELLDSTLRFSFSVNTTKEEIDYALAQVNEVLPALRKFVRK